MTPRNVSFFSRVLAGVAGIALMAGVAIADTTINNWSVQQSQGKERIRVAWSEAAPLEIHEFPAARQLVVKIPNASLSNDKLKGLEGGENTLLKSARLQPVAMSDGRPGVQLTVNFKTWADPQALAGERSMTITYANNGVIEAAPAKSLSFSNKDIEALEAGTIEAQYGTSRELVDGAGQAAEGEDSVFAAFYVPPDLSQEEKREQAIGNDIGMLNTLGLFDRFVDIEFVEASLQNIIRSIAARLNLNIIMTPGQVRGNVTVKLTNVRLGDALDALLKSNGLAYKVEPGGIVRIVNRGEVRGSDKEVETRSITVNWVSAGDVATVVEQFLSDDGTVQFFEQSNVVVVQDVPEVLSEIQKLVARLDVPEKQVRMEIRMVDMTESASRALGLRTNFSEQNLDSVLQLDADGGAGVDSDLTLQTPTLGSFGGTVAPGNGLNLIHFDESHLFNLDLDIQYQLTALEERNEAITLAAPIIMSLNNIPSLIEIKRQIPFEDAQNSTQGSVRTIKFADVGTKVEITPRITNNGYVTMLILPEQKIQVGEAIGVPVIDERFAESSVLAKDEEVIVLGGLRQFENSVTESGVPYLLRVPVLGWLFKTQETSMRRLDLFMFVRPQIVKDPDPNEFETGIYEMIDYNWELPDFYYEEIRTRRPTGYSNDPRAKSQYF